MPTIVGKVYANWCGHCQSLKPEWKKLKHMAPQLQFVEFEEAESEKRAQFEKKHAITLEVNGFPTIFKIQPGKPVEYYTGERTADKMLAWISAATGGRRRRRNTRMTKGSKKRSNKRTTRKNWFGF